MIFRRETIGFGFAACAWAAAAEGAGAAGASPLPPNYTAPTYKPEPGRAPLMQARAVSTGSGAPRTWAIIFGKGDDIMSGLADWAKREHVSGAQMQAIGAMSSALFGWFDKDRKAYLNVPVNEQVECVSLLGDVGLVSGAPMWHIHGCVATRDGTVKGGHFLNAVAWPTLEVFVTEFGTPLQKHEDPETTLELFTLET